MELFFDNFFLVSCDQKQQEIPFAHVIHGGVGTIKKENSTDEQEKVYRDKLQEALDVGYAILEKGGSALDALNQVNHVEIDSLGGDVGMIGLNKFGNIAWDLNTEGI